VYISELHHIWKAVVSWSYYPGLITALAFPVIGFFFWRELIKSFQSGIKTKVEALSAISENIMQLNAIKLANAAAVTVLILYTVCTLFVAVAPQFSMTILVGAMHLPDAAGAIGEVEVTFGGFLLGLIPLVIYTYVGAYLVASLYNRSVKS
jgi:small-conductance mechanosensitive channel